MKRLFTQFSFPGGIPSHVAPETPGSFTKAANWVMRLSHAYGAAFDNPDLIVACVVGDGEAETGAAGHELALATSSSTRPSDGAVLPILHLNGYKIAGPTVLARIPHDELDMLFAATATSRISSRATSPSRCTSRWPPRWTRSLPRSRHIQARSTRSSGFKRAAGLADDRAAHAQGLDGPEGDRRQDGRRTTGARTRCRWANCTASPSTSRCSKSG